jgi:hypothetical protein
MAPAIAWPGGIRQEPADTSGMNITRSRVPTFHKGSANPMPERPMNR